MDKQFLFEQATIRYSTEGEGDVVLLVHGFGEDSSIWHNQVQLLKDKFKVITPDLPGSGKSSLLEKNNVQITDYAYCLNELLKNEKVEKCYLAGHSMGGYITLAFAELFPDKLMGMGLINSTAFADSDEKKQTRLQGIEVINTYCAYEFLKKTIPMLFSKEFKMNHPSIVDALIEKSKSFTNRALIQYYHAMMGRPDRTDTLKHCPVKVLFVIGNQDTAAPLHDLLQQVHLPAIAYVNIIENTGHMSMFEAPEKLNQYLSEFLATP